MRLPCSTRRVGTAATPAIRFPAGRWPRGWLLVYAASWQSGFPITRVVDFVFLSELPLSPTGKIDHTAVPGIGAVANGRGERLCGTEG